MPSLFRSLLYLYPADYRRKYGEEMITVLAEVQEEAASEGLFPRAACGLRESAGLLRGVFREHAQAIFGPRTFSFYSQRRFSMRSDFRFPKATVTLMLVILATVIYAIEKAKSLQHVLPATGPSLGPIEPTHVAIMPAFFFAFALVCACAALAWAVLFALRRSGIHRFSNLNMSASHHPKPTLFN